ncbi:outer membrane beta-barrel protein [Bradyrhizobium genosp. A]|uniref:outer membrane beta-barrel protein n=1 Tax=Bradyrhizobium genosp. A TaxID=83626 RepID=UPI003CEE54AC
MPLVKRLPARDPTAVAVNDWLLYPTLRTYSLYSDNLFFAPRNGLASPGFGLTPGLIAVWTNGIHTTTLYGNIDRQIYPDANEVNTLDGRAGFAQRYEAMRDLSFVFDANYVRRTWASSLQNSIQVAQAAPTSTVLPNGNTVLPNGTIVSPTGQVVGQSTPAAGSVLPLLVNPNNHYTGTFSVEKLFNRGILTLSGSAARTEYEAQNLQNNSSRTFTEHAAFWLGPLLYTYSDGVVGTVTFDATSISTTSHRVVAGLGTDQIGRFRFLAYYGHQGSDSSGTGGGHATAGGDVYGGRIVYEPMRQWKLTGTVDITNNIASSSLATDLSLTLPGVVAVQIPTTASTRIASASVQSNYEITPLWFADCLMSYSRIEYVDGSRLDNSWILNGTLRYDIRRDTSLTWEYRYTNLQSNAPLVSVKSNYVAMGALYKF